MYTSRVEYSLEALGQVIRERREACAERMTQDDLGARAGYGAGAGVSISRIENGLTRPGPDRLKGIAKALKIGSSELQAEAEERTRELAERVDPAGRDASTTAALSIKDQAERVQNEIDHRTTVITELAEAFNVAHDRARDDFLLGFRRIALAIEGAPLPDSAELEDVEDEFDPDARTAAANRLRVSAFGVSHVLAGGVGGAAAGATAGGAAAYGTFSAAMYFGTASTGTAIGTLSGAAATNAAMAWLGGGSLAAGGAGAAGGAALLTGIVAAPALLLAIGGLIWMVRRTRKQQQELAVKLDEAAVELASTQRGFEAITDIIPRATNALDYVAVHAAHALKRWEQHLGSQPINWGSLTASQAEQYQDFVDIAASQLTVASINVQELMSSRGDERDADRVGGRGSKPGSSQDRITRLDSLGSI